MSTPERLLATAARLASARRARIAAHLLLAAALVFVLLRLRSIWHESHVDLRRIGWASLLGSALLAGAGLAGSGFVWLGILDRLGVTIRRRWIGIYLQAQLAKYVPGTVWQYAGRIALAQARSIPARAVSLSLPLELAALAGSACAASLLLLGWWALPALVLLLGAVTLWLRRTGLVDARPALRAGASAWIFDLLIWPFWGVSFWLVARSLLHVGVGDVAVYVGAFAAAWVVGLVAVYAPGGLGVREAMLVLILRGRIGASDALVLAAASRAILTIVDLAAALAGALLLRRDAAAAVSPQAP